MGADSLVEERDGSIARTVPAVAERVNAEAVVAGTRGRRELSLRSRAACPTTSSSTPIAPCSSCHPLRSLAAVRAGVRKCTERLPAAVPAPPRMRDNLGRDGRPVVRQLRDAAVASAVTAIAGKSAAPLCDANGSVVVLALEVIRCALQADLTVAPVA